MHFAGTLPLQSPQFVFVTSRRVGEDETEEHC